MRLANEKGIVALAVFALAAGATLLVRLIQREQRRRSMHDTAVETLRESGEHFLPDYSSGRQAGSEAPLTVTE